LQSKLRDSQAQVALLANRVKRNEHPRLLHWLVCNRSAKVARLKEELETACIANEAKVSRVSSAHASVEQLRRNQGKLMGLLAHQQQLESEREALFNKVVDAQPSSASLLESQAERQRSVSQLGAEQQFLSAVTGHARGMQHGLALFQQCQALYQQALSLNYEAENVNMFETRAEQRESVDDWADRSCFEARDEWHVEPWEWQEQWWQERRDQLTNEAGAIAMHGYQEVAIVLSSLPPETRARYQRIASSFGVPYPRLQGANFCEAWICDALFGTSGAEMNDFSSGCKIRQNMEVVSRCVSITVQKLDIVTTVRDAVSSNIQRLQASVEGVDRQISVERNNLFVAARASVAPHSINSRSVPAYLDNLEHPTIAGVGSRCGSSNFR